MGTYQYKPFSVMARDNGPFNWGTNVVFPASDAQLIAAANATANPNYLYWAQGAADFGSGSITFDGRFYLDTAPATPLTLNQLPAGFTIVSCALDIFSIYTWDQVVLDYSNTISFANELNDVIPGVASTTATITPALVPDIVAVSGFIKFTVNRNSFNHVATAYRNIHVYGVYSILSYTFSFPLDGTNIDLQKNRLITITSDPLDPNAMDLTHITVALGACAITIVTQTTNLLVFSIPDSCSGDGLTSVVATGDGFQFSGPVTLGGITILTTNASGIYVLTAGKTSDTLYSSLRDGTTYDVKIPDPFAKTGFIGG